MKEGNNNRQRKVQFELGIFIFHSIEISFQHTHRPENIY